MTIRELPGDDERSKQINSQVRDDARRSSLSAVTTEQVVKEKKEKDNSFLLQKGSHGGVALEKPNTSVSGSPGAEISRPTSLSESARFDGVTFKDTVTISSSSAMVTFSNCRFDMDVDPCIDMANGAKLIAVGCLFSKSSGTVINNPGVAADAQVVACSNATGHALGTATSTGVITI